MEITVISDFSTNPEAGMIISWLTSGIQRGLVTKEMVAEFLSKQGISYDFIPWPRPKGRLSRNEWVSFFKKVSAMTPEEKVELIRELGITPAAYIAARRMI